MKTSETKRILSKGTRVHKSSGTRGRIAMIFSYRADGRVRAYLVNTARGDDVWTAGSIHVGW